MSFLHPLSLLCNYALCALLGLFGIGFVIGFHELGHFLFCKLFNISTPSFSIGFGPKIFKRTIGETEFSLSAFPVGGYVEIAGAAEVGQGEQKEAHSLDERSFARKPWYQKMLVLSGGILFNLAFAYVALTLLFMAGIPKSGMLYPLNSRPIIEKVEPESAAAQAGLQAGDTIVEMDGTPVLAQDAPAHVQAAAMQTMLKELRAKPNQPVHLVVNRTEPDAAVTRHEIDATLGSQTILGKSCGSLGVSFQMQSVPGFSIVESIKYGISTTNAVIYNTLCAFRFMFSKRDVSQAGGPLAIISATMSGAGQGAKIFILLLALISINLAILNLIPVPILDGGQMLFYTIEAIIGRPLPIRIKEYIHIACWIAFMLLLVYLSAQDLKNIVWPYITKIRALIGK